MMHFCSVRTALATLVAVAVTPVAAQPVNNDMVGNVQALAAYSQQWPMLWPVLLAAMAVLFVVCVVRSWRVLAPRMDMLDHLLWGLLALGGTLPALIVVIGQGRVNAEWSPYVIFAAAAMLLLAVRHAARGWPGAVILALGAVLAVLGPAWHVWRGEADDATTVYFVLCCGWVLSQLVVGLPLALRLETWSERLTLQVEDRPQVGDEVPSMSLRERARESLERETPTGPTPEPLLAGVAESAGAVEADEPIETPTVLTIARSDNPLHAQIDAAIECARVADEPLAVFCVRVANAADASRILGAHVVEDAMGELARRLAERLPRHQRALRMGASNLIFLHEDVCDRATLTAVADKAEAVFALPCEHPEGMLRLNGHVAYAVLGVDGHDALALVRAALTRAAAGRR